MKLHLTYCSSSDGIKTIKLFKYIIHRQSEIEMTYKKDDLNIIQMNVYPANRIIYGYDNIRVALKSIFPTIIDLVPIKKIPLAHLSLEHVRKINRIE